MSLDWIQASGLLFSLRLILPVLVGDCVHQNARNNEEPAAELSQRATLDRQEVVRDVPVGSTGTVLQEVVLDLNQLLGFEAQSNMDLFTGRWRFLAVNCFDVPANPLSYVVDQLSGERRTVSGASAGYTGRRRSFTGKFL